MSQAVGSEMSGASAGGAGNAILRDVQVVSLAGEPVARLAAVDLGATTGRDLRRRVARVAGFPHAVVKLVSASGARVSDVALLAEQPELQEIGALVLSCVLCMPKPGGPKDAATVQKFGGFSKAGLLLTRRIVEAERVGKHPVSTLRAPDAVSVRRGEAQKLISESFAPWLGPLIAAGIDAALQNDTGEDAAHIFEDPERDLVADFSTCALWLRVLGKEFSTESARWLRALGAEDAGQPAVASAILWRLLPDFSGSPEDAPGGAVPAGPVLEVLFLATHPMLRESGEVRKIIGELEKAAKELGCVAAAVAAVPAQGRQFWKQCGYTVAVPLKVKETEIREPATSAPEGPGEPVTPLGAFLLERMLLFTDTPLVAKVL